ncbi:DUF2268 domain-containing putative Zn-dependent protease [Escherichia coli]|nr:DUF2268 domain-containing putative Zn-dependent protease [Escherichia coli]
MVVKVGKLVLPEKGHHGFYPEVGVVYRTVAQKIHNFAKLCALHCFLECLHMNCIVLLDGPRYGSTLGEVIVSEGLAGHFSLELLLVNLTQRKLTSDIVQPYRLHLLENWYSTDYDCNAWLFGTGDLPRWLEYQRF